MGYFFLYDGDNVVVFVWCVVGLDGKVVGIVLEVG